MEELNLKDLLNYFISKIWIIIVITALGLILGSVYSVYIQKPLYHSSTTIVLARTNDNTIEGSTAITQNEIMLNQKLVSTYRAIIKSKRILNQVIANLDLDLDYANLYKGITVTNESDTELLRLTVSNEDAKMAKKIANEIAHVFSNEIIEIYSIKNVSIIDYAEEEDAPYNVSIIKQVGLAGILGFVLSSSLVFTMFYFDTTIKNTSEIEEKLSLPVLGAVPLDHRKRRKGGKK